MGREVLDEVAAVVDHTSEHLQQRRRRAERVALREGAPGVRRYRLFLVVDPRDARAAVVHDQREVVAVAERPAQRRDARPAPQDFKEVHLLDEVMPPFERLAGRVQLLVIMPGECRTVRHGADRDDDDLPCPQAAVAHALRSPPSELLADRHVRFGLHLPVLRRRPAFVEPGLDRAHARHVLAIDDTGLHC